MRVDTQTILAIDDVVITRSHRISVRHTADASGHLLHHQHHQVLLPYFFHPISKLFPYYFQTISILFPYYFHIISIVPALLVSVLFVSPLLPLPFPVIRSRFHAPIQFGLPLPFQSETFDAAAWMLQKVSISRVASSIISSVRSFADATQIPPIDFLEHYLMHCRPSCTVESLLMTCVSVIVMQLSFQYCPRAP